MGASSGQSRLGHTHPPLGGRGGRGRPRPTSKGALHLASRINPSVNSTPRRRVLLLDALEVGIFESFPETPRTTPGGFRGRTYPSRRRGQRSRPCAQGPPFSSSLSEVSTPEGCAVRTDIPGGRCCSLHSRPTPPPGFAGAAGAAGFPVISRKRPERRRSCQSLVPWEAFCQRWQKWGASSEKAFLEYWLLFEASRMILHLIRNLGELRT